MNISESQKKVLIELAGILFFTIVIVEWLLLGMAMFGTAYKIILAGFGLKYVKQKNLT